MKTKPSFSAFPSILLLSLCAWLAGCESTPVSSPSTTTTSNGTTVTTSPDGTTVTTTSPMTTTTVLAVGPLEVQVNVPPSWRPMLSDDIADAFVSRVTDVFQRQGYRGQIKEVTAFDKPDPGAQLLTINLIEWRVDVTGNIQCTFSANLQTDNTSRNLGTFTETTFRWMNGPGRFGLADSFGDAAEGAIRQLYDNLARSGVVPGLTR